METIETLSQEYSQKVGLDENEEFIYLQGLKAGVEFAQQWISVDDELPEIEIEVIVKTINSKYSISKMYIPKDCNGTILGKKEWKGSGTFKSSITHWRQINLV